jgi:hypothetical protein
LKSVEDLKSEKKLAYIDPYEDLFDQDLESFHSRIDESSIHNGNDKVTFLCGDKDRVMFGSKEGRVTHFVLSKQEMETFELP